MMSLAEAKSLPLAADVDVLVVGGGPAGTAAGFAAARMGARTLIVEQFNCLGGIATAGGHAHISLYSKWGNSTRVVGGVAFEIARRVSGAGFGMHDNSACDFEIEGLKLVLEQMAEECSCGFLYHTLFAETVVEDGTVQGAVVQSKDGRRFIRAKQTVDCTGDGDVAASAGCAFSVGDEETGLCQAVTLMFTIGGVDWQRVKEFRAGDSKLQHVWKQAQDDGVMRPYQNQIMGWWLTTTRPDQVGVNFTHINFVDGRKAEDLTRATVEGRKQAYETIEVYRRYIPGMESCYMISTPNTVGVRESRRITGRYVLTREDVVAQRRFGDSIGFGSFFIDIHGTKGPGMDAKEWRPDAGFCYQIPYRILVPESMENLLVAGRCVSCDHEALGSIRVMPQCGVTGQAAGVAAAMSAVSGAAPSEIDAGELQAELQGQECIVTDDDVERANEG